MNIRLASDIIGTDETTFPHNSLLTDRQVAGLCKVLMNGTFKFIKLSKTQVSKTILSEGFLGRLLGPLVKVELPLMKIVLTPLIKSGLIPLGLTAAVRTASDGMHKIILGSGTKTLISSNKKMEDIMKIVKSLGGSGMLIKAVTQAIEN